MELKTVEPLRKMQSKYDVILKGKTIRFVIEPHRDGIAAKFCVERTFKDTVPPFIMQLVGRGPEDDVIHLDTLVSRCFHLKWYDRLFGQTLERKVERWAIARKKELDDISRSEGEAERLRSIIG